MELASVIMGQVVTEKSERQKAASRTYTLRVDPRATKIDVKNAIKRFYDVEVTSVRIVRTRPKVRLIGRNKSMEKRHRTKRALITLSAKSKPLDLTSFKA